MASAPKPVAAPQFKIKQRKRNAVHKYEPDQFKANLIALLPADTLDLEKYYSVLETNEAKIDIKRYAEPFFEIFIVGDLLAPGGVIANVENSFCIFSAQESIESIKPVVQIVERLSRRYKYLPVKLDETLAHLLQYINKFGENSNKLAIAVALFVTSGLAPASVMHQLLKEHLVKDRLALDFFVLFLQTCLHELTLDQVTTIIRKNGLDAKIPDFFPQSDRQEELVAAHMESVGLSEVYAFYLKQQSTVIKDQTFQTLIQMFTESTPALVTAFLNEVMAANSWAAEEMIPLLWDALLASDEWGTKGDYIEKTFVRLITLWAPVFEALCEPPKCQMCLTIKIQQACYDDSRFLKYFSIILQQFFKHDVLSDAAIIYWYEKGALPVGKTLMQKQLEAFVAWLREQESDDEDEDED